MVSAARSPGTGNRQVNQMSDEDRVFRGRNQFQSYLQAVESVEGGTVSPGGAALIMGFSREGVWDMIRRGAVRSWTFYEDWSARPDYVEVSIRDLVEWGVQRGRIRSYRDCHMASELLRKEVERALAKVTPDTHQVSR